MSGKSSFLWALQTSLKNEKSIFDLNILPNQKNDVITIIGEYGSLFDSMCNELEISNKERNLKVLLVNYFKFNNLNDPFIKKSLEAKASN